MRSNLFMKPPGEEQEKHRRHRRSRHFLAAWLRAPLKMGAVIPSSHALARAMAAQIDPAGAGTVVELGAGTGVVTHALLDAGVPPGRLIVIERDPGLHAILSAQFPQLTVICADAVRLDEVLTAQGVTRINAVVSSLPLLSMPRAVKQVIERKMAVLGGMLVQFTYGPRSPISRAVQQQYRLTGRRARIVLANVPPAHVWVYETQVTK